MSQPLEYNPNMGDEESHLAVMENRLNSAREELRIAQELGKPTEQISALETEVDRLAEEVEEFKNSLPTAA